MTSESVFISCARENADAADSLDRGLARASFSVYVDRERMRAGSFSDQLDRAIATCDACLFLISSVSVNSMFVNGELHVAADDHQRPIRPGVLEDVDVSPFRLTIAGLQRVDYSAGSDQKVADGVDDVYRTAVLWRFSRPSEGLPAARVFGSVVAARGLLLLSGGRGFFFVLFAQAWNPGPDSRPSSKRESLRSHYPDPGPNKRLRSQKLATGDASEAGDAENPSAPADLPVAVDTVQTVKCGCILADVTVHG